MDQLGQRIIGQLASTRSIAEPDQGVRLAQGRFLDELPGAAFALITLVWIVSSFAGLMWRDVPSELIAHFQRFAQAAFGSHTVTMMSRVAGVTSFAKAVYGFAGPRGSA